MSSYRDSLLQVTLLLSLGPHLPQSASSQCHARRVSGLLNVLLSPTGLFVDIISVYAPVNGKGLVSLFVMAQVLVYI